MDCRVSIEHYVLVYNAQLHNPLPSIHLVTLVLKKTQEATCTKILQQVQYILEIILGSKKRKENN